VKLIEVTWQHRYDFEGIAQCEFCQHKQKLARGYDDANFHINVIPAIECASCGKRTTEKTLPLISDPGTQAGDT
jgi:hypothetical protein